MTFKQACMVASKRARAYGYCQFVMLDGSGEGYEVASECDLDGWYAGSTPIAAFGPDGSRDD